MRQSHYCNGCHKTTQHHMDRENRKAVCTKCNREMAWDPNYRKGGRRR